MKRVANSNQNGSKFAMAVASDSGNAATGYSASVQSCVVLDSGSVRRAFLTNVERDALLKTCNYLYWPAGVTDDKEVFLNASQRWLISESPKWLIKAISDWKTDPHRPGVFLIENMPIDTDLPPTPTDGRRSPHKLTNVAEAVLAAVCSLVGEPFAFHDEREGHLIQDLTPVRGRESALTNEGTGRLGWHNEHAVTGMLLRPQVPILVSYLAFIGLRPDPAGQAKTLVADIRDATQLLDNSDLEALRAPEFQMRPPYLVRQTLPLDQQLVGPVPVLTGPIDAPQVAVALYGDMVEALSERARRALEALKTALDSVQRGLPTTPGTMYLVDNRFVLHSRSPFIARFDGMDRWLLRMMVTDSLFPLRSWQKSARRILQP